MSTISKDAHLEILAGPGVHTLKNDFATKFRVWQVLQDSGPVFFFQLANGMRRKNGRERGMLLCERNMKGT